MTGIQASPVRRRFRWLVRGGFAALAGLTLLVGALFLASLRWSFFVQNRWISLEAMGGLLEMHRAARPWRA